MGGSPTNLPWLSHQIEDGPVISQGGIVIKILAEEALNVGDIVFVNTDGKAEKSSTAGDYTSVAGVVVGGEAYSNIMDYVADELDNPSPVGYAASTIEDQYVLVQISGIAWVVAADDGITAGLSLGVGTVAGRLDPASDETTVGVTLSAGDDGDPVKILIQPKIIPSP